MIHPQIFTLKCGFWGNDLEYKPGNGSLYESWHHVACVCDYANGRARKLYVDGVLVASDNPSSWYVGGGDLWMGRKRPSTSQWDFKGYIDEARAYTRALTAAEIKALAARWMRRTPASPNRSVLPETATARSMPRPMRRPSRPPSTPWARPAARCALSGTCTGVTERDGHPTTGRTPDSRVERQQVA